MYAIVSHVLMTLAAAALPQLVAAEKDKRPDVPRPEAKREQPKDRQRPDAEARRGRGAGPEVMFNRLDANHDGVLTSDEVPAGAPARLKEALERAIKSHDGKLRQSQFAEAMRQSLPRPRPEGRAGEPQGQRGDQRRLGEPREGKWFAERRPGRDEGPQPWQQRFGEGRGPRDMADGPGPRPWRPEAGPRGGGRGEGPRGWNRDGGPRPFEGGWGMEQRPRQRANMAQWGWQQPPWSRYGRGPMRPQGPWARPAGFDPKAIFARLDRDKDGKLSLEEFSAGLRRFQRMMFGGMQQRHPAYDSHFGPRSHRGWAMHQPWARHGGPQRGHYAWAAQGSWAHQGRHHGHRGQLAHWQGKKKAEDSLKANLARLERQRDELTARLRRAEERLKAKELATTEKDRKPETKSERKPADDKKPSRNL